MMRKEIYLYGDTSFGGAKYFAQQNAVTLHLTGLSKKDKEKIIVEVQGEDTNIDKFLKKVSKGSPFFKVTKVESKDIEEVPEEKVFAIK